MKIKTSELTGAALDWAAALALGRKTFGVPYSTNWQESGPIIEREGVALRRHGKSGLWYAQRSEVLGDSQAPSWAKHNYAITPHGEEPKLLLFTGPTPLIAAMRCFVASKLGDEVEIPKELV